MILLERTIRVYNLPLATKLRATEERERERALDMPIVSTGVRYFSIRVRFFSSILFSPQEEIFSLVSSFFTKKKKKNEQ